MTDAAKPMSAGETLTLKQLTELLQMSEQSVLRLHYVDGILPPPIIDVPRLRRWRKRTILDWMDRQERIR